MSIAIVMFVAHNNSCVHKVPVSLARKEARKEASHNNYRLHHSLSSMYIVEG